jgi:hypothetical protein
MFCFSAVAGAAMIAIDRSTANTRFILGNFIEKIP